MLKTPPAAERRDEAARGQVLVVFALSLITLLGFAGLALDGGSTFAQRRSQQTAADMAALAAANDYLVNGSASLAGPRAARPITARQRVHQRHGRHDRCDRARHEQRHRGARSRSTAPHQNAMASLLGQPVVDGHDDRHRARRLPGHRLRRVAVHLPGLGVLERRHGAVPDADATSARPTATSRRAELDFAWTNYGTGNVSSTEVDDDHQGQHDDQQDARVRRVHRPAQQRQPHHAVQRRGHVPLAASTSRRRSSTPTATSSAGRRSTSSARTAARPSTSAATSSARSRAPACRSRRARRTTARATSARTSSS